MALSHSQNGKSDDEFSDANRRKHAPRLRRHWDDHLASAGPALSANSRRRDVTSGGDEPVVTDAVVTDGDDAGPGPDDLLLTAFGSCTSMTINLHAARIKVVA